MASIPTHRADPTLAIAQRQLALLRELAEMATAVCRANAAASVAAAKAVETSLADRCWRPEVARARALAGAEDAVEAFHKSARALRLTLIMETSVAEWVRDQRQGIRRPGPWASGSEAEAGSGASAPSETSQTEDRYPAGSSAAENPVTISRRKLH